jgi:hypothetical protein
MKRNPGTSWAHRRRYRARAIACACPWRYPRGNPALAGFRPAQDLPTATCDAHRLRAAQLPRIGLSRLHAACGIISAQWCGTPPRSGARLNDRSKRRAQPSFHRDAAGLADRLLISARKSGSHRVDNAGLRGPGPPPDSTFSSSFQPLFWLHTS